MFPQQPAQNGPCRQRAEHWNTRFGGAFAASAGYRGIDPGTKRNRTGTSFSSAERYRASGLKAPGAADDTFAYVRPIERDGQRDAGARVAPSISTV